MRTSSRRNRSLAEWITLLLSVLIIGALVALALIEESRRHESAWGDIEVTFDRERAVLMGASYYIPYTIRNTGSGAVSSAEIWIEVFDGEQLVESAEVTVEFLPLDGQQEGIFVTGHDPARSTLRGRLESLQFP